MTLDFGHSKSGIQPKSNFLQNKAFFHNLVLDYFLILPPQALWTWLRHPRRVNKKKAFYENFKINNLNLQNFKKKKKHLHRDQIFAEPIFFLRMSVEPFFFVNLLGCHTWLQPRVIQQTAFSHRLLHICTEFYRLTYNYLQNLTVLQASAEFYRR